MPFLCTRIRPTTIIVNPTNSLDFQENELESPLPTKSFIVSNKGDIVRLISVAVGGGVGGFLSRMYVEAILRPYPQQLTAEQKDLIDRDVILKGGTLSVAIGTLAGYLTFVILDTCL